MKNASSIRLRALVFSLLIILISIPASLLQAQTVTVTGAGSGSYNTGYGYWNNTNSKPAYEFNCNTYDIYWDGAQWVLVSGATIVYTNSHDTPKPPDSDWQLGVGSAPAPAMSGDVTALPFPVEFLSFEGEGTREGTVELHWSTGSELNNTGFDVQRRTASGKWESLDFVPGAGTSTEVQRYSFEEEQTEQARIYYRLRQVDLDGLYSFSRQIEVDLRAKLAELELYPNPVSGSTLTLKIPGQDDAQLLGTIRDIYGREVQRMKLHTGENAIAVSGLSSGLYLMEIYYEGQVRMERFQVK